MSPAKKISIKTLKVEDIMTSTVFAVTPVMTLREIVLLFLDKKISGAPIVDQSGKVMSVISQSDLIQFIALEGMTKTVNAYLPKLPRIGNLVTVNKTDLFRDVFKQFLVNPVRRIIVIDDNGSLQGIVSKSNLLKAFIEADS